MDSCCRSKEVCKLVMFLVGAASIAAIAVLSYQTVMNFGGHEYTCHLWLDIVGRISLFVISFYVAGLCGYIPYLDEFRPQRFPRPFLVWKLCTQCSGCLGCCARASRMCACRTRTSSRTPLLENCHYSPNLQESLGSRFCVPGGVTSRPDYVLERIPETKTVAGFYPPEIEIFHFEGSQPNDASEFAEVSECSLPPYHPTDYDLQINMPKQPAIPLRSPPPYRPPDNGLPADRPRHPVIPWGVLRLDKTINRWPSDYDLVNMKLGLYENDPTSCRCSEGLEKGVVKCSGCKKRVRTYSSHVRHNTIPIYRKLDRTRSVQLENPDLKGALKECGSPETSSKLNTNTGHGDLDSTRVERLAYCFDSKGACGTSKKHVSTKEVSKLEGTAVGNGEFDLIPADRSTDLSDVKGACGTLKKSVSQRATTKLGTVEGVDQGQLESPTVTKRFAHSSGKQISPKISSKLNRNGAAVAVRRDVQENPVSDPDPSEDESRRKMQQR